MLEKSVGCVIFRKEEEPLYLLLHYPHDHWDYAKGHVERGEKEVDTAVRETDEETGITDLHFVEGFRETINYFFKRNGKTINKSVVFLIAETKQTEVKLSHEHKAYKWMPFKEAMQQLTFQNARSILEKAHDHLKTNPSVTQFTGD